MYMIDNMSGVPVYEQIVQQTERFILAGILPPDAPMSSGEGRGMTDGVAGMTFAEEAALMKALGCTQALNLDGGGSSCLLVQGQETIKVSDGSQRPVGSVVILKKK